MKLSLKPQSLSTTKLTILSAISLAVGFVLAVPEPAFASFKICNKSAETLSVAYGYRRPFSSNSGGLMVVTDAAWVSKGWWVLSSGECAMTYRDRLSNRYSYFYVMNKSYEGNEGNKKASFCVDLIQAFDIAQEDDDDDFKCDGNFLTKHGLRVGRVEWRQFARIDTGDYDNYTLNLW